MLLVTESEMDTWSCPSCGRDVPPDIAACLDCGQPAGVAARFLANWKLQIILLICTFLYFGAVAFGLLYVWR